MRLGKCMMLAAVLGLPAMVPSQASAAVYTYATTLLSWSANPVNPGDEFDSVAVANGYDKVFAFESTTFSLTLPVTFTFDSTAKTFSIEIGNMLSVPRPARRQLKYNVEIVPANSNFVFDALEVDATEQSNTVTITTQVFSDAARTNPLTASLTSLNGSSQQGSIAGDWQKIWVTNDFVSNSTGLSRSFVNTLTQRTIPEPPTLALLISMMGLGLLFNRRREAQRS